MRTFSRRYVLAWLALFGIFGFALVVILGNFALQLSGIELARAATPTETFTLAPTKFALAVESPTPTPSQTPTFTPSPTATSTRAPTRTPTPTATAKPTALPTITPSPTPTTVSVGESFGTLTVYPSPSDHSTSPVELNIAARGMVPAQATLGLVDIEGPADAGAPQLFSLFVDERVPAFKQVYQVNAWDWDCNCAAAPLTGAEVSMVGIVVTPGEIIRVPRSSYYIGNDYQALVLYADRTHITFNYTRTGNPVRGYTIYLDNIAVDGSLVTLYQQTNAAGRVELPALKPGQAIGRAQSDPITVAIRDAGAFMDPRSRKDWWQGK